MSDHQNPSHPHRAAIRDGDDYVTTMDPYRGGLKITNQDIFRAVPFPEHGPEYLRWPDHLWKDRTMGVPDHDIGHNAWHIKYLAEQMIEASGWIGNPLQLYECAKCVCDGNHRYRAVQYLREVQCIVIEPDIQPGLYPGCRSYCQRSIPPA
jgi:hypothetical protein